MTDKRKDTDYEYLGEPLSFWRSCSWWPPENTKATVTAGVPGHERELVVNLEGYDLDNRIPTAVFDILVDIMPQDWKFEYRGSRIECHPTGVFAGGFTQFDCDLLKASLFGLGFYPFSHRSSAT
jgi:hypothetical protein